VEELTEFGRSVWIFLCALVIRKSLNTTEITSLHFNENLEKNGYWSRRRVIDARKGRYGLNIGTGRIGKGQV
jgi:hypothetical protein